MGHLPDLFKPSKELLTITEISNLTVNLDDHFLHLSNNSKSAYKSDWSLFRAFLAKEKEKLSLNGLKKYIDSLESGDFAPSTISRKLLSIKRIMETGLVSNEADLRMLRQFFKEIKISKEVRPDIDSQMISKEDLLKLIEISPIKLGLIISFLFYSACRISEAVNVKMKDIVCQKGDVTSIKILGKGKKLRTVFLPSKLITDIKEVFKGDSYLMETNKKAPYNRHTIKSLIYKYSFIILKKKLSPHYFRHLRLTRMLNNGESLKAVSRYAGHSSVSITADIYINDSLSEEGSLVI